MRSPVLGTRLPLSEEAYLELGETTERIELFDGSLYLTARGQPRRQFIVGKLMDALQPDATASGLHLIGPVNLRLRRDRITNPDLIMTGPIDFDSPVVDARSAVLVAEVASRSDEVIRMLKHHFYAAAGIPWFLLVEEETGVLHLHQLAASKITAWPAIAALTPEDLVPPS
jgi:hypothetical protein